MTLDSHQKKASEEHSIREEKTYFTSEFITLPQGLSGNENILAKYFKCYFLFS